MLIPARMAKLRCVTLPRFQYRVARELQRLGTAEFYDVKAEGKGREQLRPIKVQWEERLNSIIPRVEQTIMEMERSRRIPLGIALFGRKAVTIEMQEFRDAEIIERAERLVADVSREKAAIAKIKDLKERKRRLRLLKKSSYPRLLIERERLQDLKARVDALKKFGRTKSSLHFGFYAPRHRKEAVLRALERAAGKLIQAEELEIAGSPPPVLLRNPPVIRSFEWITEGYSYPPYNGIDPTPLLALGFIALFGLMFADIGFGAILVALSLTVFFSTRKADRLRRNLNIVLASCGFSSIFFGLMFGEFFGTLVKAEPIWFEPVGNVYFLLIFSLLIGIAHLALSSVSLIINDAASKRPVTHGASELAIIAGILLLVYRFDFSAAALLLAGFALLIAARRTEAVLDVVAMFANVLSFLRVGALSLAHILITGVLAAAIKSMPDNALGLVLGAALFIIGSVILIALGTFVVTVQSTRLYLVEFLPRIYHGQGRKFSPLALRKEYLYS